MGKDPFLKEVFFPHTPHFQELSHVESFWIHIVRSTIVFPRVILSEENITMWYFRSRTRRAMRSIGIYKGLRLSFLKEKVILKQNSKILYEIPASRCSLVCSVRFAQLRKLRLRFASLRMTYKRNVERTNLNKKQNPAVKFFEKGCGGKAFKKVFLCTLMLLS